MGKSMRSSAPVPWWIWVIWTVGPIETFFFMAMTWVAVTALWTAAWLTALWVALRLSRRSQRREVIEWPPANTSVAKPSRPAVKAAPRREQLVQRPKPQLIEPSKPQLAKPSRQQLPSVPYRPAVRVVDPDDRGPIRVTVVQGKPIRNRH